ncbi:CorA family divalent cation transporter [Flagellimonas allohymeniacidonis]|uniref:Magnesium and cobalt transport protein CorA n=1 Tax=Flagellimonas allohymeniacidonis TaxID=2517819 RepID=A0A4Q8QG21_9FLAO|nr:CorA family divalent cation transporter [Allomuricauda hymeniacidonis]TAI49492.1 magnesium and cobalt transport protein CorA [Allomuricauda hymeniacidonis]
MAKDFINSTSLIRYSPKDYENTKIDTIESLNFKDKNGHIRWFNTYGTQYAEVFSTVIQNNELDDFLIRLLREKVQTNRVIELDGHLFVAIQVLKTERNQLDYEQMFFIGSSGFVWSIQEKLGDYFDWIRERLENGKGIARRKKADYLLFLLLESIIENYRETYKNFIQLDSDKLSYAAIRTTPEFTERIERRKQDYLSFKKACSSLRDTIVKLEKVEIKGFEVKYFSELKEQINNLVTDIDFELHELESKVNLIFSIQGHRLNEVMKTLTVFSVIFIPLTFLAGIYGMNFKNIPELEYQYGYFILIAVMLLVVLITLWYFKRKKWF